VVGRRGRQRMRLACEEISPRNHMNALHKNPNCYATSAIAHLGRTAKKKPSSSCAKSLLPFERPTLVVLWRQRFFGHAQVRRESLWRVAACPTHC
jgi:hypothetical protein